MCCSRASARSVVLAMAADPGRGLADRRPEDRHDNRACRLVGWVIVLTSTFLINHFELFGLHQVANNLTGRGYPSRVPDAAILQFRAASDLPWFHHRVLGGAHDDRRASAFRRGDHGLHLRRHPLGGARPGRLFGDDYRNYTNGFRCCCPGASRPDQSSKPRARVKATPNPARRRPSR